MTYISNDPSYWPYLEWNHRYNYFIIASLTIVIYDWVLTFAQEASWYHHWCSHLTKIEQQLELILWNARFNMQWVFFADVYFPIQLLITLLGLFLQVDNFNSCNILWFMLAWTPPIINAMLGVIMATRIHAMYQGSKRILTFLIVVLLACTIASVVMTVIGNIGVSGVENIRSGNRQCSENMNTEDAHLNVETLIPTTVWEILALCLAVWIVVKKFCELKKSQAGANIRECFMVLMRGHMLYFVAFAAVSCFNLSILSPNLSSFSVGVDFYYGISEVAQAMQMFVLGPRLILSIREYHAQLAESSDEATCFTTIDYP
ncbi:uncharacterized protein HD556DRAFT_1476870 [Suillus plorans]|uniref:Uncharacterized protein n=1 Tax=Suillus plorans TaxID=116603 RepID=A0A9P7DGR5_9AGAM|nr:uncharacterized protein HD556DRAFT_1476870 [Suillus plorans]KAG1793606.1 hypothetical protein HD556DRAFT_1476870 [Suillus plorans]